MQGIVHHKRSLPAKRVAITGGIACGKSALGSHLIKLGFDVIDTDHIVHRIEGLGGCAVAPIVAAFGNEVIAADGSIDRVALGSLAFGDPVKLQALNAIVHPMVRAELDKWFHERSKSLCFAIIPLLFEVKWHEYWDCIVCVACQPEEQMRRLQGRGLSAAAARQRVAAQLPVAEKVRRSDYVIWNDGTEVMLKTDAERLVKKLCGSRL